MSGPGMERKSPKLESYQFELSRDEKALPWPSSSRSVFMASHSPDFVCMTGHVESLTLPSSNLSAKLPKKVEFLKNFEKLKSFC